MRLTLLPSFAANLSRIACIRAMSTSVAVQHLSHPYDALESGGSQWHSDVGGHATSCLNVYVDNGGKREHAYLMINPQIVGMGQSESRN